MVEERIGIGELKKRIKRAYERGDEKAADEFYEQYEREWELAREEQRKAREEQAKHNPKSITGSTALLPPLREDQKARFKKAAEMFPTVYEEGAREEDELGPVTPNIIRPEDLAKMKKSAEDARSRYISQRDRLENEARKISDEYWRLKDSESMGNYKLLTEKEFQMKKASLELADAVSTIRNYSSRISSIEFQESQLAAEERLAAVEAQQAAQVATYPVPIAVIAGGREKKKSEKEVK